MLSAFYMEIHVQQLSSLVLVFVTLTIFSANFVHAPSTGPSVGLLFIGPLVFYFIAHTMLYLGARIMRGRDGVASYTGSKLNRVSALMTVLAAIAAI